MDGENEVYRVKGRRWEIESPRDLNGLVQRDRRVQVKAESDEGCGVDTRTLNTSEIRGGFVANERELSLNPGNGSESGFSGPRMDSTLCLLYCCVTVLLY